MRLIGTVSSPEKARLARANGAWETIDYSRENVVERVLDLTDGKKVPVVYDGVGKDTWEASLDCLEPRGLMVSYGNSSGAVTGVSLGILASKGSLYVTRPTLATHVAQRSKLESASDELFGLVKKGAIEIKIETELPARRGWPRSRRSGRQKDHRLHRPQGRLSVRRASLAGALDRRRAIVLGVVALKALDLRL